ncbi:cbb3-type cytochrome oxidase assembly protein CcoS [Shewanella sp. 1_MG-2023]|uniref:cbb3-type cytochrome oxidase assembly protein CcoS n=1 Tax=unclassified Shewanella TaxID=196818 RepID=UPI0026E1ACD3|nr:MULTISPECIES: cbb3-type cytochrome oxidase assembly protein CcoS [unclassified Shewanella]MDO6613746.1 cbb3-type cytochrome oxidase assembly protein CcoS [Shewanella sp. 7_MG-2023]MDO6772646.1 cbb3-type cytochrome oxidase assembly protein CcoS [Shewanella sp. 2_MG-2023]MDO6796550.1 cbb3-type cytochrome oxidase assembly protein CcoS [Shewanella sp. 1_MG-2023]
MSIIYVLIPIAMLFVVVAVAVFFWAVKSEQFDDLDRQSVSILFDEDKPTVTTDYTKTLNDDVVTANSFDDEQIDSDKSATKKTPQID